jgi:hypothetical protein
VRAIPLRRDVFGRCRVVERVPLAEKLGVGHLQFECVALENGFELCRRPRFAGLFLTPEYAAPGLHDARRRNVQLPVGEGVKNGPNAG